MGYSYDNVFKISKQGNSIDILRGSPRDLAALIVDEIPIKGTKLGLRLTEDKRYADIQKLV